ncbi:MAG: FHA domain-containing protein [Desulfobacteraceae bacterium]
MKKALEIIVQLIHIHGPMKGDIQEFNKKEILIGRHSTCDLRFPGELNTISRKHALIKREGNRFQILDTSANGLFINGKKEKQAYLRDGDVLIFSTGGPKVSFLTKMDDATDQQQNEQEDKIVTSRPEGNVSVKSSEPDHSPPVQEQHSSAPRENKDSFRHPVEQQDHFYSGFEFNTQEASNPSEAVSQPFLEKTKTPLVIQFGIRLESYKELPITIGKDETCDFILNHPGIEGRHLEFFFQGRHYHVKDITGRNQVLINSNPIHSISRLMPRDKISFSENGPVFQFLDGGRLIEVVSEKKQISEENSDDEGDKNNDAPDSVKKDRASFLKTLFK